MKSRCQVSQWVWPITRWQTPLLFILQGSFFTNIWKQCCEQPTLSCWTSEALAPATCTTWPQGFSYEPRLPTGMPPACNKTRHWVWLNPLCTILLRHRFQLPLYEATSSSLFGWAHSFMTPDTCPQDSMNLRDWPQTLQHGIFNWQSWKQPFTWHIILNRIWGILASWQCQRKNYRLLFPVASSSWCTTTSTNSNEQ